MLIDVAAHLIIGVCIALAGTRVHGNQSLLRSASLWTVVVFSGFFVGPLMVYLMSRNPEWFLHYVWPVERFAAPLVAVQLLPFGVALGAYLGVRHLLVSRPGRLTEVVVFATSVTLAVLLVLGGWSRIAMVGTTEEAIAEDGLRPLLETSEGYLIAGALAALALGTLLTVWRVFVYARATPVAPRYTGSIPVRDGHTKALDRNDANEAASGKKARV